MNLIAKINDGTNRKNSVTANDPVRLTAGELYSEIEDLSIPGLDPAVDVKRSYGSFNDVCYSMGVGWNLNYDTRILLGVDETNDIGFPFQLEYSNNALYRNQYNVNKINRDANPELEQVGIGKLVLVDEEGTTHLYKIVTAPDYDSTIYFSDGRRNYYPQGSQGTAALPTDDALTIQPNGDYQLTKKDGTQYTYNYWGRLKKITARNGRSLQFGYGSGLTLATITDGFGRVVQFTFTNGFLSRVTDPLGRAYSYSYTNNQLTSVMDPENQTYTYTYGDHGMTESRDPDGTGWRTFYKELNGQWVVDYQLDNRNAVYGFSYDPANRQTTITNRRGMATTHHYNERQLSEVIDQPYGYSIQQVYDANNNLVSATDQNGKTTHYDYDSRRNLTLTTDPLGQTVFFTYNEYNQVTGIKDKANNIISYSYDTAGNLIRIDNPDGSSRNFTYGAPGLMIQSTDQRGNITGFGYDAYSYLQTTTYPDGTTGQYQYDLVGRLLQTTDGRGAVTQYEYDNIGRVTKNTNPMGCVTKFSYTPGGKLASTQDPKGNITSYNYNNRGNLKEILDATGRSLNFSYDNNENVIQKVLASQITRLYEYDNLDRLITSTNQETGVTQRYAYDPVGNLTSLTNGESQPWSYVYDAVNRKIRETDPLGFAVQYEYTANNQLKTFTDKRGKSTSYTYDSMGRVTRITDALGKQISFTYDAAGNLTNQTDARGNTTIYEYDSMNRLIKETDALGCVTSYGYDAAGNLISITDPQGNLTTMAYNLAGWLKKITNPKGGIKSYAYDNNGNRIKYTDENGVVTQYTYDAANRLTQITDGLGQVTSFGYNCSDKIIWREDALGNRTNYDYDALGQLVKVTDPLGKQMVYQYDRAGNLISETDQEGSRTAYQYDRAGRLLQTQDALNRRIAYQYDANGNVTGMTDPNNNLVQYQYDDLNRLVREQKPLGRSQSYEYDGNGNLSAQTDYSNARTTYSYDPLNRLLETTMADGSKKTFTYDPVGNLTRAVNGAADEKFYYNELSQLIKAETTDVIESDTKTVEYTYNQAGAVTSVSTSADKFGVRKTTYAYDAINRLARVTFPNGGQVQYTYDNLNRVMERINSNQTGIRYSYTARGEVESLVNYSKAGGSEQILQSYGYLYNGRGQRTYQVEGDGSLTAYQYDPAGQLAKVWYPFTDKKKIQDLKERLYLGAIADDTASYFKFINGVSGLNPADQSNLQIQLTSFNTLLYNTARDNSVPPKEVTLTGNSIGYPVVDPVNFGASDGDQAALSNLYQKIKSGAGTFDPYASCWSESFTYDNNGNVTRKQNGWGEINYQYNQANQLLQAGNRSFQYNTNGNLAKETQGKYTMDYTYTWNRLAIAKAGAQDTSWGVVLSSESRYRYDALDRTFSKRVLPFNDPNKYADYYIYDGLEPEPLAEYHQTLTGEVRQLNGIDEYYCGNGEMLASRWIDTPDQASGYSDPDPLKNVHFYHQDALGSMVLLTDSAGAKSKFFEYDAYGNATRGNLAETIPWSGSLHNRVPFGFTGQRFDPESGIYSFPYRNYNPMTMRWMEEDPLGDGLNPYLYCYSDPVNWIDPLGLCGEPTGLSVTLNFGLGVYEAGRDTVVGLVNTFLHFDQTVEGIVNAYNHPQETINAIRDSVINGWNTFQTGNADVKAKIIGKVLGEVGLAVVGTKGIDKAVKAIKGLRTVEQVGTAGMKLDLQFFASARSPKAIVIGEGMDDVKFVARQLRKQGVKAKWYQAWGKNFPKGRFMTSEEIEAAKIRNIRWIDSKINSGYDIYSIGLDPERTIRSPFYPVELERINYYNYPVINIESWRPLK